MISLEKLLYTYSNKPIAILEQKNGIQDYTKIDLSVHNKDIKQIDITSPLVCQDYITSVLSKTRSKVAYGGYLEKRGIYANTSSFNAEKENNRDIHLGVDFWAPAGTKIVTPINGKVHSFKNNSVIGDYGPTIILEHQIDTTIFYTLYGHLSLSSITDLCIGKEFAQGEKLGELGETAINVNYAPHLHFQIIKDLEGKHGDYPGVSSKKDIAFYSSNCPDPNLLLSLGL